MSLHNKLLFALALVTAPLVASSEELPSKEKTELTAKQAEEELVELAAKTDKTVRTLYQLPRSEKRNLTIVLAIATMNKITALFTSKFGTTEDLNKKIEQYRLYKAGINAAKCVQPFASAVRHPIATLCFAKNAVIENASNKLSKIKTRLQRGGWIN